MEDFKIDFQTAVLLGSYLLSIAGLYWKIRIDVAGLRLNIDTINQDRKEKWERYEKEQCDKWKKHDEAQDKQDACLDEIMRSLSELRGDMKVLIERISNFHK